MKINLNEMRQKINNLKKYYLLSTSQECIDINVSKKPYALISVLNDCYKIEVYNSYSIKDFLKSKSYEFDGYTKSWDKYFNNTEDIDIELPIFIDWNNVLQIG